MQAIQDKATTPETVEQRHLKVEVYEGETEQAFAKMACDHCRRKTNGE